MPVTIGLVNTSTVCTNDQIKALVPALQTQLSSHFAPFYGIDGEIKFIDNPAPTAVDYWPLVIADTANDPGALGEHMTKLGMPWGVVGAADDQKAGANISVTISHEHLEMRADAYVNQTAIIDYRMGRFFGGTTAAIAWEVCDAVEADNLGYKIGDVLVSDFQLPWWFGGEVPGAYAAKYSFTGACKESFSIDSNGGVHGLLKGGYIGIRQFRATGGWSTVNARHVEEAQDFAQHMDKMLPPERAHILLGDGTRVSPLDIPTYSRRARTIHNMTAY